MNLTEDQKEYLEARLIKNCTPDPETKCWEWNLYKNKGNGYGQFWIGTDEHGKNLWNNAHKVSYEVFHGPVPEGMEVAHTCHNRCCINPNHLVAKTHRENVQMSMDAGRWCKGEAKPNSKLTEEMVRTIRERTIFNHLTAQAVANIFGVSVHAIRDVLSGRRWSHVAV